MRQRTSRPVHPTLRPAPSVEELNRLRLRWRLLCVIPATVIAAAAAVSILAEIMLVKEVYLALTKQQDGSGQIVAAALTFLLFVMTVCYLVSWAGTLWAKHSPLRDSQIGQVTRVVNDTTIEFYHPASLVSLRRYRAEVLAMDRDFTEYDLDTMSIYCENVIAWGTRLKEFEREQTDRIQVYGDAHLADELTKATIARVSRR